jgi:hypothetical protein
MRIYSVSIDDLDIQISKLREQASGILKKAEELERFRDRVVEWGTESLTTGPQPIAATRKTRKQEITDFLIANGPHTRKDICEATGIPDGTVDYEMANAKQTFVNTDRGLWDVAEHLRQPRHARPLAEESGINDDDVPF